MLCALLFSGLLFGPLQAPPAADRPPRPVVDLRSAAVAVYAPALAADWPTAAERIGDIDTAMRDLPPNVGKADLRQQLRGRVRALKDTIRDRQPLAAAANANWIARLADEIAASYETTVSPDARLLGYYGRAIAIDARRPHRRGARADLADLRTVWDRVEPMVLQRNGVDTARQFGDALAGLDAAVARGDLTSAAKAEVAASEQVTTALRNGASAAR